MKDEVLYVRVSVGVCVRDGKELVRHIYIHGTHLLTLDMSKVREMVVAVAAATGGGMRTAAMVVVALVKCSSSTY
jgi:site-specific recombinase